MSEQVLDVLRSVGARVFERGWLSSNNVLFAEAGATTVVDTGYAIQAQMTMALLSDALGGGARCSGSSTRTCIPTIAAEMQRCRDTGSAKLGCRKRPLTLSADGMRAY